MAGIGSYDVDGWTDLVPSVGSRILYVSSSTGDNSYNGLYPVHTGGLNGPKRTIRENTEAGGAYNQLRDENPDWLCLLCGDTFTENGATGGITWELGGLSASEPMVMTSYRMDGETVVYHEGTRPILNDTSIIHNNNAAPVVNHDLCFVNLEFKGNAGTGTAFQWSGSILNILIEGCLIYDWNILGDFASGNKFATLGMATPTNIYFRRNVCHSGYGMGWMFSNHNGLLIEENLFDLCGVLADGAPHNTLHDVYTQKIRNLTARKNIFARAGNFGLKMSADFIAGNSHGDYTDFVVENNLFYNAGISNDWSGRLAPPPLIKFPIESNVSSTIDPDATAFAGSVTSGSISSVQTTNGTFHLLEDTANVIDIVYGWDMWFDSAVSPDQWLDEGRVATGVVIACYLQGSGDEMKVKAWNFDTESWDTIGTLTGADTTTVVTQTLSLTSDHTGPLDDAHEGKVYIRLTTDSTTPSVLALDQLTLTADPAYTHKDGLVKDNVFTMAGRKFGYETAEWNGIPGAGQDLQAYVLSGDTIDWDGNLLVHKPNRINQTPMAWTISYYLTDITVRNFVVYNWYYSASGATENDYLNLYSKTGITLSDNQVDEDPETYPDPTRSVATYYDDVLGATVSDDEDVEDDYGVAFLVAARSQLSRTNWNTAYTAAEVNDWIREGFGIDPDNPTTFGGDTSGTCDQNADYVTGILSASDSVDGMTTPNFTVISAASNGEASINPTTGAWSYTPDADWFGSDSFTVRVTDDLGNHDTQIISITVNEVSGGTKTYYVFSAGGLYYAFKTET